MKIVLCGRGLPFYRRHQSVQGRGSCSKCPRLVLAAHSVDVGGFSVVLVVQGVLLLILYFLWFVFIKDPPCLCRFDGIPGRATPLALVVVVLVPLVVLDVVALALALVVHVLALVALMLVVVVM